MATAVIAQVSNFQRGQRIVHTSSAAQLVNATLDHKITVSGIERLFIEVTVAVAALTGFAIKAQATPTAPVVTLYSVAADFTAPKGIVVGASGDLTTQGVGTGWLLLDTLAFEFITITLTSGGTATAALEIGGA